MKSIREIAIEAGVKPNIIESEIDMEFLENFAKLVKAADDGEIPKEYLLAKLQRVIPLFQEARDALTALTEAQRKLHNISPTLADRMDFAGTYSISQWKGKT